MEGTDLWYRKLGFYSNPLSIKPAAFSDNLIGYGRIVEEIKSLIEQGSFVFIEGKLGTGKTAVLKKIINYFRGQKKVIYYSLDQSEKNIDLDSLLHGRYGFIGKLLKIKPKGIILLLDESAEIKIKDINKIEEYFNKRYFKSVIFVSTGIGKVKHSSEIKRLVEEKIFKVGELRKDEVIQIVRQRIGSIHIISDKILGEIHSYGQTPREILMNTESVLRYAVENNMKEISERDVSVAMEKYGGY